MCSSKSAPTDIKATGQNNNADSNQVKIIENIQDHGQMLMILLIIIIVILTSHLVFRIYKSHKKQIIRQHNFKSRLQLADTNN